MEKRFTKSNLVSEIWVNLWLEFCKSNMRNLAKFAEISVKFAMIY